MSVDFGCIETCIFPDFEDYVDPFEDEGMSEEEEVLNENNPVSIITFLILWCDYYFFCVSFLFY
jgi:hypothetical protein